MFVKKDIKLEIQEHLKEMRRIIESSAIDGSGYISITDKNRLAYIKKEMDRMGLTAKVIFPNQAQSGEFEVTVRGPRPNMTPEQKKAYDEWFLTVNGIDPHKTKNF